MANPLSGFWERLTPRERVYILALVLTFFVMGTATLFYLRSGALRDIEGDIEEYRLALDKVHTRGSVYEERLEAKERRESKIASEEVKFSSLLERAQAGLDGVSPSDQEALPPLALGEGLKKMTFEFRLNSVTLENLVKLLVNIESRAKNIILTEEIHIRSNSSSEDRLNVEVKLATWVREKDEQDGEDDGEGEEDDS